MGSRRDLAAVDFEELQEAVELLTDEGYHVRGVDDVERTRDGVEWTLTVEAADETTKPLRAYAGSGGDSVVPDHAAPTDDAKQAIDEATPEEVDEAVDDVDFDETVKVPAEYKGEDESEDDEQDDTEAHREGHDEDVQEDGAQDHSVDVDEDVQEDGAQDHSVDVDEDVQEEDDTSDQKADPAGAKTATLEGIGTYEVRDYGSPQLPFSGEVQKRLVENDADRVTVREHDGRLELVPGESDEWPDYSATSSPITLGAPGVDVLGVDPGDEVRATLDGDVIVLEPLTDDDSPDSGTDRIHDDDVLEALEDRHEEGKTWVKSSTLADDLDVSPQKVGQHLGNLHDDELVERYNEERSQTGWQSVEFDVDDESEDSEDAPDPQGEYWCGYCGAGPMASDDVRDHHDDEAHAGDPVVLDEQPSAEQDADADDADGDGDDVTVDAPDGHRVGDPVDDAEETSADGGATTVATDADLPGDLSVDGLEESIEEHESIPYLGVMADRFDLSEGEMRGILHDTGLYGDVIDASEPRGGGV